MLYRLFRLVANHSIHGDYFLVIWTTRYVLPRGHMKATQTNTEESERAVFPTSTTQ